MRAEIKIYNKNMPIILYKFYDFSSHLEFADYELNDLVVKFNLVVIKLTEKSF